jgi:hypothetical protein
MKIAQATPESCARPEVGTPPRNDGAGNHPFARPSRRGARPIHAHAAAPVRRPALLLFCGGPAP